jgi:hypothetical protein
MQKKKKKKERKKNVIICIHVLFVVTAFSNNIIKTTIHGKICITPHRPSTNISPWADIGVSGR